MTARQDGQKSIGFLLIPGFSLLSYACTIEPLRAANTLSGRQLYLWEHVSSDGAPATSSNGTRIDCNHDVGARIDVDLLLVCAGGNPALFRHAPTLHWLRRMARSGSRIGGVSAGPYVLAQAGLLRGHRCTVHWEHLPAFREVFPTANVGRTLFEIDRDRLTCAGGLAALDLMHAVIEADHGAGLANAVSDWFLHGQARIGSGFQRMTLRERYGVSHPGLLRVLGLMLERLETPLSRQQLAAAAGVSLRQLERLFRTHLGTGLAAHYLSLRLDHAQNLLRQSTLDIAEITVACGFVSASNFSRSYRRRFGRSPSDERRRAASGSAGIDRPDTAAIKP